MVWIVLPFLIATGECSQCVGESACRACTTCDHCAHCNSGGRCGVCSTGKVRRGTTRSGTKSKARFVSSTTTTRKAIPNVDLTSTANRDKIEAWIKQARAHVLTGTELSQIGSLARYVRNGIYAWHGLKFKSEDLIALYPRYSWYQAVTSDASSVQKKFSKIEVANVSKLASRG
ncbi:MAG: YARHG domain-containing protein [Fimbriimonadaceae bacterium]